jgi:hypothetical protein
VESCGTAPVNKINLHQENSWQNRRWRPNEDIEFDWRTRLCENMCRTDRRAKVAKCAPEPRLAAQPDHSQWNSERLEWYARRQLQRQEKVAVRPAMSRLQLATFYTNILATDPGN